MKLLDLHLGKPLTRGALSVFPIWNGQAVMARGYDLGGSDLTVAERAGSAVVAELVVTNSGPRPALILEGELLEGGQQHRVASRSALIPAGGSHVLEVRCVEQGRWSGSAAHHGNGRRAPISVRSTSDQQATWDRVREYENRYGRNDTGSLLDATHDADRAAARLVQGIAPLPFQSGVLLCLSGQPVQLEVFDSPRTLSKVWDSLLLAAAVDALPLPPLATPGRRARRFLDRVLEAPFTSQPAGLGSSIQGASPYVRMSALTWRGRAVHAVALNPCHELVSA